MRKDRHEYYHGKKGKKYGIYNTSKKCFQFGICEDTPMLAEARLFQLIGDDARKWRFEPRQLSVADLLELRRREREQEKRRQAQAAKDYTPTCPRGYDDCVWDPAYIKHHYPDWFAKLWGNRTPEQAAQSPGGCFDKYKNDPNEKYYCYDDEDK